MFITTYTWLVLGLSLLALCEWFNVEVFVAAKTITVKQSCTSLTCTLTGTSYCCPNIRAALRITQDYDRVYITSGEYSGHSNTQLCTSPTYSVQYNCTFHHVAMYGEAQGLVKILGSDTNTRALHIKDTSFALIANITFANFNVDYDSSQTGGAIVVENSTSTFSNIAFHNNSAALGGAISFTRSNVVITDCLFTNNYVKTAGGAVNAVNTNLTIIRTDFLTNVASFFDSKNISTDSTSEVATTGGAISLIGNSLQHVHIIDCHFNNNSAERFGGAIGIEPESFSRGLKYVIIENTQFLGNQVTGIGGCVSTSSCNAVGGAIYVDAFNVTISGSKFIANTVQTVTSTQVKPSFSSLL